MDDCGDVADVARRCGRERSTAPWPRTGAARAAAGRWAAPAAVGPDV